MTTNVWLKNGKVFSLFPETGNLQTGDGTSSLIYKDSPKASIQAVIRGAGVVAATVSIYGTNTVFGEGVLLGTFTLSGAAPQTDGFTTDAPWKYLYAIITGSSGAITMINVFVGV